MHTYVPINYAERFYEFLESFYENELHQIYEEVLVEEELNHLELFLKRYIEYGEEEIKNGGDKKPTIYKWCIIISSRPLEIKKRPFFIKNRYNVVTTTNIKGVNL